MNTIMDLFPDGKIECPNVTLIAQDGSDLKINGCGVISYQDYQLQVITQEDLMIIFAERESKARSGEIIPTSEYFYLEAIDINGKKWESDQVLISSRKLTENGSILDASIYELINTTNEPGQEVFSIKLLYKDEIEIPTNTYIKTIKEELHSGKTLENETKLTISKKSFYGLSFELFNDNGWTVLNISSDKNLTEMIAQRISEAFQFITAYSTSWDGMFLYGKNKNLLKTILRFNRPAKKSDFAPIRHDNHLLYENDFWTLFEKYFTFISSNQTDRIHPLSWMIFDIQSVENNILVQALVWSTAMESILTDYFEPIESSINDEIEKVKCHVKNCGNYSQEFQNRMIGTLTAMKKPRPKDYLRLFIDSNFIEKDLYSAYDEIRNAAAHGKKADIEKIQAYLTKLLKVLVLFYKLVFLRIGYTGNYINYGEFGYPDKACNPESNGK